jgi:hypothetical protein
MWVYGKVEPGWYCASARWNTRWANHLVSLGYRVRRNKGDRYDYPGGLD